MKTKFLKLELKTDANGSNLEEVRQKMYAAIDENVPETAREKARKQADDLVSELLRDGPAALSAKSVIGAIIAATDAIEDLPRAVRRIAQTLDTPSHIFDLGAAMGNLVSACGHLEMAKQALEEYLACDHANHKTEPKEPEGPLS